MTEDVEILDQVDQQDPQPEPKLSEQNRKHLDSIVHQMVINGEKDEAIQFVVDDFKKKYTSTQKASGLASAVGSKVPVDLMSQWEQPKEHKAIIGGKEYGTTPEAIEAAQMERMGLSGLQKKAQKAQENINLNLHTNDAHYEKLIREDRANSYSMEQMQKDYQKAGQIIPIGKENQWLEREKKRQYELPVTPEDITDAKTGVILNEKGTRGFLNRIGDKKLLADAYLADMHQSAANDPNGNARAPVIAKQAKQVEKGKLNYDPESGTLTKPESFYQSLVTSWHQKNKAFDDYDRYTDGDKPTTIALLEQDRKNIDPDKPIPVPEGFGGKAGALIGGNPVSVLLSGGIASAAATMVGAPEAAPLAAKITSAGVGAHDFYKMAYGTTLPQAYDYFRNQGLSEEEAYDKASHLAGSQAAVDAVTGGIMGAVSFGKAFNPTGITKAFGSSLIKGLKQVGETALAKGFEGSAIGGIGAAGQILKNIQAQQAGMPVDTYEGVGEQFKVGIGYALGAALLTKGSKLLTGPVKEGLKQGLSKMPEEQLTQEMNNLVQTGEITEHQAKLTIEEIREHKAVDEMIPEGISEVNRLKIGAKIRERNILEEKIKNTDKAFHEDLKERVKKLNEDILTLGSEKEEKADNAKLVEKNIDKIPEVYRETAKRDPDGFLQFIADQSFGRDENGTVMEGQSAEPEMRKNFGDKLVDKAKVLYPLTQNIEQDALRQQSAAEMGAHPIGNESVGRAVESSGMGQGKQGEILTGTRPEEESNVAGQKEIGTESPVDKIYELPFEEEPGEKKSGIKNAISYKERYERTLPKVEVPKLGSDTEVIAQGKELVDSGKIDPRNVVDRINQTNEGMHPDEAKAMQYYMHQLAQHETNLREELAAAKTPEQQAEINGQLQQLSDEMDAATSANIKSGKAWSDVGNIRQIVIDSGFNPSRERAIIADAYGGKLPEHVAAKLDKITKERDTALAEKAKLEESIKNKAAEATVEKIKEVVAKEEKTKGKAKKEQLKKERDSLLDELKNAIKKDTSAGYAFPFPKNTIEVIGKLAINYFKEGFVTLEEIAGKVFEDIKDHFPGATKKDVRDVISRYDPLRETAKDISQEKLEAKEARTEKAIEKGEFIKPKTTPALNFEKDTEWVKANQRVVNAEYKLKEEKRKAFESQKNMLQKGLMWLGRATRLSVLSGYNVLGKLAAAATVGGALKRMPEQAIGKIYSVIFKGIAEKAPIEGSPNLSAEAKFYKEFFDPKKFGQNAWQIIKTGSSDLTKKMGSGEYEHVPLLYLPTDLHAVIKDPLKRATFEASFKNAMAWAQKQGLDINDPLVIQAMETAAYKRAQYEIFQEQNWVSKKFSEFKRSMEKKGNIGALGKFIADFMIPVSTVPTNIAKRLASTSPIGLLRGSVKVLQAYRKGMENLSNEEADAVMRQLKQGSLGTALWLVGWFGAAHFGGLYSKFDPNKKRRAGDLDSDQMEVNGTMIPKPVQHALPLEIMQLAATMRRIHDNYAYRKHEGEFSANYHAAMGAIGATVEQIPVLETGVHMVEAGKDPYAAEKLKEDITRRFEPQILRETGIIGDSKKKKH